MDHTNQEACSFRQGPLPACAQLAVPYMPVQQCSSPAYEMPEALRRGTLFPGLDLPFMNMVNTADVADTPLGEVMGLCFAAHELLLYLDTHPEDQQAFQTYQGLLALSAEAKRRYTAQYGPLRPEDLAESDRFTWTEQPWPWQYEKQGRTE